MGPNAGFQDRERELSLLDRAAASHAWTDVFVAGNGWLSLDPTHGADLHRHLLLARALVDAARRRADLTQPLA